MNTKPDSDIDAILGGDPGATDVEQRARLVARLAPAPKLSDSPDPDTAELAAYLDGGLPEGTKERLYLHFAASPQARADLDSAADLLDAVENAPQRPPEALVERARKLLAVNEGAALPSPSIWRSLWLSLWPMTPRGRLATGFAFAVILGLLLWVPKELGPPGTGSAPQVATNGRGDEARDALVGEARQKSDSPPGVAPPSLWSAVAISKADGAYGVAKSAGRREDAENAALANCAAQHGTGCVIAFSGPAQCVAVASALNSPPVAAAGANISEARQNALKLCDSSRTEIWRCTLKTSICSGD